LWVIASIAIATLIAIRAILYARCAVNQFWFVMSVFEAIRSRMNTTVSATGMPFVVDEDEDEDEDETRFLIGVCACSVLLL
jgi:hypothetical protein